MPDISMVQQTLLQALSVITSAAPTLSENCVADHAGASMTFLTPVLLDDNVPVTTATGTRIQTATLSRSQSQVVQFLDNGDVFNAPDLHDRLAEHLSYLKKSGTISNQPPVKTPVMHPNLVCTLKSILSPKMELRLNVSQAANSINGSNSLSIPVADSVLRDASFEERINALEEDSSSKAGSPENHSSWPTSMQVSLDQKGKFLEPEAVLVPVDLIQNRRPYQCAFAECQRTFKNPQTMRMHLKTHFSNASAAAAAAASNLGGADIHQTLLPLPGCATSTSLNIKAGHNKKIPSRCPTCYKTFVGLYELRRHFGRKHSEGEKHHACRKCGKRFHIEVDVRDHEKLCGEPIVCNCGMKFAFKCNLVAHKRTHPKCQDHPLPTTSNVHDVDTNHVKQQIMSKRLKLSEDQLCNLERTPSPEVRSGDGHDASTADQMQRQAPSPVGLQPCGSSGLGYSGAASGSSSSSSPFSSTTSSPSSSSFVAEALPDFDVTSSSSLLAVDINYHDHVDYSCLINSAGLLQGFPLDHYFLAYQAVVPQERRASK